MIIELKDVTIREVVDSYENNQEEGVLGYGGLLNIRPKYQREFIYSQKQQEAVMGTIMKGLPLNLMYWVKVEDEDGLSSYEVMDGQQRTLSFCSYVSGDYAINYQYFHNLTEEEQNKILDYELMVYVAEGSERKKLEWFKIINIAGEKLTNQELRNAIYTGPWLEDAKRYFSQTNCPAHQLGSDFMSGSPIRQDYLEEVIKWGKHDKESIEEYMGTRQHHEQASALWLYYQAVIAWASTIFNVVRKEMKGLPWGEYYNHYEGIELNAHTVEGQIKELMQDPDVTKKKGIYPYILTGDTRHLNIRAFDNRQRREAYESQGGICSRCNEYFVIDEMEADHITPWSKGGKTDSENCQMLCKDCNRRKSDT